MVFRLKKTCMIKSTWFAKIDSIITEWMSSNGYLLIRISVGVIFVWFGLLKFFPGLSPAQELATKTIKFLSFGLIPDFIIIKGLAFWEVLIGIGLIFGKYIRGTLFLLFLQLTGTFAPLFFFPNDVFTHFPYALTLEGQYIIDADN